MWAQVAFASSIIYATSISTIKMSIVLLYQRLFRTPKFVAATRAVAAAVLAWWIVVVIVQIFSCNPIKGQWDLSTPSKCISAAHFYVGVAVLNILTDVVLLLMPLPMIWRLQMSQLQKVTLSITFMTGTLYVCPCMIKRFAMPRS